jgi:hypothetical protein
MQLEATRTGVLYRVTHAATGRVYIGRTTQAPRDRWLAHLRAARKGSTGRFHRALRKHGAEAFVFEVVTPPLPLYALNDAERRFIAEAGETFNLTAGGEGCLDPDPEVRQRLRAASARSLARPEVKAKLSKATASVWADPEARAARIAAQKASHASPEAKARRSENTRRAWADPERRAQRAKAIAAALPLDIEQRRAAGNSAAWADPARRAARIAAIQAGHRAAAPVRRWVHAKHGEFVGAAWALAEAFPEQLRGSKTLLSVASVRIPHYKCWRVTKGGV